MNRVKILLEQDLRVLRLGNVESNEYGRSSGERCDSILATNSIHKGDVFHAGRFLAFTLLLAPAIPLGLSLKIKQSSRSASVVVPNGSLLVEAVELKLLIIIHILDLGVFSTSLNVLSCIFEHFGGHKICLDKQYQQINYLFHLLQQLKLTISAIAPYLINLKIPLNMPLFETHSEGQQSQKNQNIFDQTFELKQKWSVYDRLCVDSCLLYKYSLNIYTLMGHQISAERHLRVPVKQGIQEKYHTNLFLKNRKSSHQFHQELKSICKRSSYLHYDWAELLLTELKTGDPNQLYSEYQTTLKENCLRDGKREKIFCPAKIQRQFISHFGQKAREEAPMSAERLDRAFEQTKSYFMVMSWLHKMVTLSANDQENKGSHVSQEWDLTEEEHIYEILLNLAQSTFRKNRPLNTQNQCQSRQEFLNVNLARLVKRLTAQRLKFFEKEAIVAKIQEELQADPTNIEQNVGNLKKILGEDMIYGHLKTIREVGHFDVNYLWKFFGEELF